MTTSAFFLERKNLQQELEITIEDTIVQQNRLLAVVDTLMQSRVHSSMDLLMQEGERYGSPKLASTGAAYAAIKSGNAFYGQVDTLGTPYLTGYEPMFNANKEVIGAWYVGYQANLNELEQSISQLRVLDKS